MFEFDSRLARTRDFSRHGFGKVFVYVFDSALLHFVVVVVVVVRLWLQIASQSKIFNRVEIILRFVDVADT